MNKNDIWDLAIDNLKNRWVNFTEKDIKIEYGKLLDNKRSRTPTHDELDYLRKDDLGDEQDNERFDNLQEEQEQHTRHLIEYLNN